MSHTAAFGHCTHRGSARQRGHVQRDTVGPNQHAPDSTVCRSLGTGDIGRVPNFTRQFRTIASVCPFTLTPQCRLARHLTGASLFRRLPCAARIAHCGRRLSSSVNLQVGSAPGRNGVKMIYPPDRLQKLFDLDPPSRIRHWLAGHRRHVQELRLDLTERPIGPKMAIDIVLNSHNCRRAIPKKRWTRRVLCRDA
jgi:hypothetical protein